MADQTKPRAKRVRIFITTNAAGEVVATNRATSITQAQAFYQDTLTTREVTDDEIFAIAKEDRKIGGLENPSAPKDDRQQDAFAN